MNTNSNNSNANLPLGLYQAIAKALWEKLVEIKLDKTEKLMQHGLYWTIDYNALPLRRDWRVHLFDHPITMQRLGIAPSTWLQRQRARQIILEEAWALTGTQAVDSADALISFCQWHRHPPATLIRRYHTLLKQDSFLLGCAFGPDTLRELRTVCRSINIDFTPNNIPDMHDVGDLIQQHGFSDVVVDTDRYRMTYNSAATLLKDLRLLGELGSHTSSGLLTPRLWERFIDSLDAQLQNDPHITIEVVYFHGWKTSALPAQRQDADGTVHVPLSISRRQS